MKKTHRPSRKYSWAPNSVAINLRVADTTAAALQKRSDEMGISVSKLVRYMVERGLKLPKPGMMNADFKLWAQHEP